MTQQPTSTEAAFIENVIGEQGFLAQLESANHFDKELFAEMYTQLEQMIKELHGSQKMDRKVAGCVHAVLLELVLRGSNIQHGHVTKDAYAKLSNLTANLFWGT